LQLPSLESGAEATAVQALRDELVRQRCAKRLDCGAFTAALAWRDNQFSHRMKAANVSSSSGGEGGCLTILAAADIRRRLAQFNESASLRRRLRL
jgi:hypothetical protein